MKKIISALFLLAAVVFIVIGTVSLLNTKEDSKKGNEKDDKEISYNAIFELDDKNKITSFKKNEKEIVLKITTPESTATFNTELKDSKTTIIIGKSTAMFEFTDKGIVVKKNDLFKEGLYKKTKEYTKEEFYSNSFGNIDYVKSELNYVYKKGENSIYLYEKESDAIRAICNTDGRRIDVEFKKTGDNQYTAELFDNNYRLDIIDSGIKLTFDGEAASSFNGDYTKDKRLEMDEIISLFTAV